MNEQIEALKMAIERLEVFQMGFGGLGDVIQACKEALAEAEKQEPVGKMCLGCGTSMSDEKLEEKKRHNKYLVSCCPDRQMVDVYTHPTTWQSLSDDEIATIWMNESVPMIGTKFKQVYVAIEQALKEKNHA